MSSTSTAREPAPNDTVEEASQQQRVDAGMSHRAPSCSLLFDRDRTRRSVHSHKDSSSSYVIDIHNKEVSPDEVNLSTRQVDNSESTPVCRTEFCAAVSSATGIMLIGASASTRLIEF